MPIPTLQFQRVIPYEALPEDLLVTGPRLFRFCKVVREIAPDELRPGNAGSFFGCMVNIRYFPVDADRDQWIQARLDQAAGVKRFLHTTRRSAP